MSIMRTHVANSGMGKVKRWHICECLLLLFSLFLPVFLFRCSQTSTHQDVAIG